MKFNYNGNFHNVEMVDKDGYDNCSGFENTQPVEGPYIFNGTTLGKYYFVCGVRSMLNSQNITNLFFEQVGSHCASGKLKAIITVSSNC